MALDFPPDLDELFGVTPDKQTIVFTDRVTAMLEANGVFRAFKSLVAQVAKERAQLKSDPRHRGGSRRPAGIGGDDRQGGFQGCAPDTQDGQGDQAGGRGELQGAGQAPVRGDRGPRGAGARGAGTSRREKPYRVDFADLSEDLAFYVPKMDGTQTVLEINTEHPWYREVYLRLAENPEM